MKPPQVMSYVLAALLWGMVGVLLVTDHDVPGELYGAGTASLYAVGLFTQRPGADSSRPE